MNYIVDQQKVWKVSSKNSKIFYVEPFLCFMASFSKESIGNIFPVRIQVVNNNIGIALVTRSKHNNLKILAKLFEALGSIRANIDSSLYLWIVGKGYF